MRKIQSKWVCKAKQSSMYYFLQNYTKVVLWEQAPEIFVERKLQNIYRRLFTLSSYFLTKESYDWWIIRRKWGFKQQISEDKNLTESITNIWEHTGGFRKLKHDLRKFRKLKVSISQKKVDFATWILWFRSLRNCLSTWCGCLPMAITSSFQLLFAHRLKRWTPDFPSFENDI